MKTIIFLFLMLLVAGCSKHTVAPVVHNFDVSHFGSIQIKSIHFEAKNASLSGHGYSELVSAMFYVKSNRTANFYIDGHADDNGNFAKDSVLAFERATTLLRYVEGYGLNGSNFIVRGFADKKDTSATKNKRVDIYFQN